MMSKLVLHFREIDKSSLPLVGGKGANLGEMTRAGFPVPPGFCVTTEAYRAFIGQSAKMDAYFRQLERMEAGDLDAIAELGRSIREHMSSLPMPGPIREAIADSWRRLGENKAYAIRSSATAEDLPTASFAGQQDTYLNVRGEEQLLDAVRRCWASLFTDRAISYRAKHRFDHRGVHLSVVVQQMVFPDVSGIMFTADPISGHRGTVSIDASFGLGEALVSGLVSADLYRVRSGAIVEKKIARKKAAIYSLPEGGTVTKELPAPLQERQALEDGQIAELAELGKRIERHYGAEQDIEWCCENGQWFIVQSRPITSLYPLPKVPATPGEPPHLLLSFGHQQMMTEAMTPTALSVLRTMFPFGKPALRSESELTYAAGGRMYVDITPLFQLRLLRRRFPQLLGNIDEMMSLGVSEFLAKEAAACDRLPGRPGLRRGLLTFVGPIVARSIGGLLFGDPSRAVHSLDAKIEAWAKQCEQRLSGVAGAERIARIQEQAGTLLRTFFRELLPYPLPGIVAGKLIAALAKRWLGEADAIHSLNKSLPGNITSEMGLMIGDLADAARPYPQVAELIDSGDSARFRERLNEAEGGEAFAREWERFMRFYGMRCPGEIDVTRPRWREDAGTLLPAVASHMRSVKPGEHRRKFEQGAQEAEAAAQRLLEQLRRQPFGRLKARLMSRLIRVFRHRMALREHPKYAMMRQFGHFREALLEEARSLVKAGTLQREGDAFYLTLDEWLALAEGRPAADLEQLLEQRKRDLAWYRTLTPPRLMTSEGEQLTGRRQRQDVPEGALLGTPVSAGVVEGIARVVLRPEEAKLSEGEILIAPFTDPGWTPLFHSAVGLVMEVGGLMTHGAVVAREYGLPAVVGIDGATSRIPDGARIRLDGTRGYVEVLVPPGDNRS